MTGLNATHDPARKSWVDCANAPGSDFPIQNLPWGVFSEADGTRRVGVAIGDMIVDVTTLEAEGVIEPAPGARVFAEAVLNPFLALGPAAWSDTRARIADLLDAEAGDRALPLVPFESLGTLLGAVWTHFGHLLENFLVKFVCFCRIAAC